MSPKLKRLIEQQSKDDQTNQIHDDTRVGNRTISRLTEKDWKHVEWSASKRRARDFNFIYLEGIGSWRGSEHAAFDRGEIPCPVCQGRELREKELCLCCCRSGEDGKRDFQGLEVGKYINEGWKDDDEPATPTKYEPSNLKGGL